MTDEPAGHGDEQWQLDGDAAELYQRHLVPAVTAGWAADLVERAGLRRGERVLDVACGTGVVAALAEMRRVLVTGGRLGLTVYGPIEPGYDRPPGYDRLGAESGWRHGCVR